MPSATPLIPSLVCSQLEALINQALRYAPGTHLELAHLAGKSIGFDLTTPGIQFSFMIEPEHILVRPHIDIDANAVIQGSAFTVLRHLSKGSTHGQWLASDVAIDGDTELVQSVSRVIKNNDLDLEEALAERIGDVAAQQVGQLSRRVFSFVHRTGKELLSQTLAPVESDTRARVTPDEADAFYRDVDTLRTDYDRLEARLQRLLQRQHKADTP